MRVLLGKRYKCGRKDDVMLAGKSARAEQVREFDYTGNFCNNSEVGISMRLKANHFLPRSLMLAPR